MTNHVRSNGSRPSPAPVREKIALNPLLTCPYCQLPQRTPGWFGWHIRKYHVVKEEINSPARVRARVKAPMTMEAAARSARYRGDLKAAELYERWAKDGMAW